MNKSEEKMEVDESKEDEAINQDLFKLTDIISKQKIKEIINNIVNNPYNLSQYLNYPVLISDYNNARSMITIRIDVLQFVYEVMKDNSTSMNAKYKKLMKILNESELKSSNFLINCLQPQKEYPFQDIDVDDVIKYRKKDRASYKLLEWVAKLNNNPRLHYNLRLRENYLMRFKLHVMNEYQLQQFIEQNEIQLNRLPDDEKEQMKDRLMKSYHITSNDTFQSKIFYKFDFHKIAHLIRFRKLVITRGKVIIPIDKMKPLLMYFTRKYLKIEYQSTDAKEVERYAESLDEEIKFLKSFKNSMESKFISSDIRDLKIDFCISARSLDKDSSTSFPLCMKLIYNDFNRNNNMKYFTRFNFVLFLKDNGLSKEDSIKYFVPKFETSRGKGSSMVTEIKYSINHAYGKVGRKRGGTTWTCNQIQSKSKTLPKEEIIRCPFDCQSKTDENILRALLKLNKVPESEIAKIMKKSVEHPSKGCLMAFNVIHGTSHYKEFQSPVHYTQESYKALKSFDNYTPDIEDMVI